MGQLEPTTIAAARHARWWQATRIMSAADGARTVVPSAWQAAKMPRLFRPQATHAAPGVNIYARRQRRQVAAHARAQRTGKTE